ncbi:hypothetical protein [Pelagicoccus albus]|uniref:YfdX protein n=1 Tax=Pelagicoccus albus TaxID=415222 RepID=A0A7X1B2R4_9BACT|nr:hypothetical protein [Pelagicoccus albus]MBC2604576.1 hypothetical protein [Pelagicoccus albus]
MGKYHTCRFTLTLVALTSLGATPSLWAKRIPNLSDEKIASSTANKLQHDLKELEAYNLSFRIDVARKILESTPTPRAKKQLDRLLQQRATILSAIENAAESSRPISTRLNSLAAYSNYFLADEALAQTLAESEFKRDLADTLSELNKNGALEELSNIATTIKASGLTTPFEDLLHTELDRAIQGKVGKQTTSEAFEILTARMLGGATPGLGLRIDLQGGSQPLWPVLKSSLRRTWGSSFQLKFDEDATPADIPIEIFSTIELAPLEEQVAETQKTIESKIPGQATATENPKFAKLLELYENADRDYKDDIERFYDTEHRYYLEEIDEIRDDSKRLVIERAREENPDLTEGQILNTSEGARQVEYELKKQVNLRNLSQPQLPEPPHERILEELSKTPPTLHKMGEETPYEYSQRSIEVNFKTTAKLSVSSPLLQSSEVSRQPTTEHNNSWFETIGAHPRDLTAAKGNYSDEARESARKLFLLDFGADCSRQLKAALSELAQKTYATGQQNGQETLIAKALAIQLSQQSTQSTKLDTATKIRLLSEIASSPGGSVPSIILSYADTLAKWPQESASVASN